jgi:hypothetical protein
MTTYFKLESGRNVSIETISIRNTYENILEGDPDYITARIWQRTPDQLEREFGQGVVILKPAEKWLPPYRLVAVLHSSPLPADFPEDYSYVTICWFQNGLNGNLVEFVRQAAKDLEWEKHAKNYTI